MTDCSAGPDTATSTGTRDFVVLGAVLAAGALLRIVPYLARPSLLLDEARIALNVAGRSWLGLLKPLDYDQTAPILFLWGVRLTTRWFGLTEYALRALPLAAGLAALPLLYIVARRFQPVREAILTVTIAAVSPLLIQYSREVKPYSLDLAVALSLLWLTLRVKEAPEEAGRRAWLLAAGIVSVWASAPAVLVLGAVTTALLLPSGGGASLRRFAWGSACAWAASFVGAYLLVYRTASVNPYLQQYWQGSLITLWKPGAPVRAWQGVRETVWATFVGGTTEPPLRAVDDVLAHVGAGALVLIAVAGAARLLGSHGRASLVLVVGPLLAGFAASAVGGYPVTARLLVYAVPSLLIPVATACLGIAESFPAARRTVASCAAACIVALPLPRDVLAAAEAGSFENVRAAVAEFQRRARPGEPIYVFAATLPAWTFYTTDWSVPDTVRLRRMARLGTSGGPAFENAPPRKHALGNEGDTLVYPYRGHPEVLGLFHGAQRRAGTGFLQYQPDTNWTANEARRIRERAGPTVWILISHSFSVERFLYPSLARLGGRADFAYDGDGFALRRYWFRE